MDSNTLAVCFTHGMFRSVSCGPLTEDATEWALGWAERHIEQANDPASAAELKLLARRLPKAGEWLRETRLGARDRITAAELKAAHDWLRDKSVEQTGSVTIFCDDG